MTDVAVTSLLVVVSGNGCSPAVTADPGVVEGGGLRGDQVLLDARQHLVGFVQTQPGGGDGEILAGLAVSVDG
jgi:hypothetical protein